MSASGSVLLKEFSRLCQRDQIRHEAQPFSGILPTLLKWNTTKLQNKNAFLKCLKFYAFNYHVIRLDFPFFSSITRYLKSILHCPLVLDATQAHCQPLSSEWLTLAFLGSSAISCTFLYFTSQAIMYFPLLHFAFSCVHNDNSNTPDQFWGTTHCSSESFGQIPTYKCIFHHCFQALDTMLY